MKKNILIAALLITLIALGTLWWIYARGRLTEIGPANIAINHTALTDEPLFGVIAKRLRVPWSMAFLPNGDIIFTERGGRVRLITRNGLTPQPLLIIDNIEAAGEGGLLGIALHPEFVKNRCFYIYYTYRNDDTDKVFNRVAKYEFREFVINPKIILDEIPAGEIHNGGRIKFGPEGYLYITTGDAGNPELAQDIDSLGGKILRVTDEGFIPSDNPYRGSPVYSLGHRNPQGIAWDDEGRLWATEHGQTAADEINLIKPGRNYGWPVIRGGQKAEEYISPQIHSGKDTWAPSGCAFYDGSLLFAGLRGQSLYYLIFNNNLDLEPLLKNKFGRLRDVVIGPDDFIYILTNNTDGRGIPMNGDDRIIRVNPEKLLGGLEDY